MKNTQQLNPLLIAGTVLLLNALIFLLLSVSFAMSGFLGVTFGCFGAGLGLVIAGLIKHKKSNAVSN